MTPHLVSQHIVVDRLNLIDDLLRTTKELTAAGKTIFFADRRNILAAESCLRRSLEALFDIGRHLLSKVLGAGITEYKETAIKLKEAAILTEEESSLLSKLAGYRNRLVHFYHEISEEELFEICANQIGDLESIQEAFRRWMRQNPQKIDSHL
jgi:uncharacterized protein YutE (UPF0331/DUF86 family)